jgi:transcription antitermination factor NusG
MSNTINTYRVATQQTFKAYRELTENHCRPRLPCEKRGKRRYPVASGYIFADSKPREAKYVKRLVGPVNRAELIKLYPRRDRGHLMPDPFAPGDTVLIERGPFAALSGVVVGKRSKRGYMVDVSIFNRMSRVSISPHYMRKHDPG